MTLSQLSVYFKKYSLAFIGGFLLILKFECSF